MPTKIICVECNWLTRHSDKVETLLCPGSSPGSQTKILGLTNVNPFFIFKEKEGLL